MKNLHRLACKFDLDQSEPKSSQVNASERKPWPNGVASRRKLKTWVYLRLRLARALKTTSTNIADLLTNKLTALSPPQYPNLFCVTITALLTCNLFLLNSLNLIVTVYVKQEKHISLKGVKPLNRMVLIRKMKLSTFLLHQLSMFRSFVLFIAVHCYFSSCNVFP